MGHGKNIHSYTEHYRGGEMGQRDVKGPKSVEDDTGSVQFSSVQFSSVDQLCPTLCHSVNCSTPGLPVHHQLPEFTQTHVHRVRDAIQPSHLSSPSPPAPNPSQQQSFPMSQLFTWGGQSTGVSALASFLPKNTQGWSPLEWTGWISCSPRDSHVWNKTGSASETSWNNHAFDN